MYNRVTQQLWLSSVLQGVSSKQPSPANDYNKVQRFYCMKLIWKIFESSIQCLKICNHEKVNVTINLDNSVKGTNTQNSSI